MGEILDQGKVIVFDLSVLNELPADVASRALTTLYDFVMDFGVEARIDRDRMIMSVKLVNKAIVRVIENPRKPPTPGVTAPPYLVVVTDGMALTYELEAEERNGELICVSIEEVEAET